MHARRKRFWLLAALFGAANTLIVVSDQTARAEVAPTASGCGTTVMKSNGTAWQCTFAENFDGTTLDTSKWYVQLTSNSGYHSGNECFVDNPNNIRVAGGTLSLTVRKEAKAFTCTAPRGKSYKSQYTSGMVSTYGKFTQAYGRFEIRAKFPGTRTRGLQSSLWMYPENPTKSWPYSGEIDIAEWYSRYPDLAIPYIHYGTSYLDKNATSTTCTVANAGDWHLYQLEWTPTYMTISYDGKQCIKTSAWVPKGTGWTPFSGKFMIALTQMLGVGSNAPTTGTVLPATMQVDHVRVWS